MANRKGAVKPLILMLGLTAPLSTDLCLPALPTIATDFAVTHTASNLVIICFFAFFAASMLVMGPLSDRFGRRRVLLACLGLFAVGNVLCAVAPSMAALAFFRSVGACGAGGMLTSSTALVKDCFEGRARTRMLAWVQMFGVLGPLVAPSVGSLMLNLFSWRASFLLLAAVGAVEAALVVTGLEAQREGAARERVASLGDSFACFASLMRRRLFWGQLVASGMGTACFMAYLATSSYIYIVDFGISEALYSLLFGVAALGTALGPRIYLGVAGRVSPFKVYAGSFAAIVVAAVLILTVGDVSPLVFFAVYLPMPIGCSVIRPYSVEQMLAQHDGDTGTLASLINFGIYAIGLLGMVLGSLAWGSHVTALGGLALAFGLLGFCAAACAFGRPRA